MNTKDIRRALAQRLRTLHVAGSLEVILENRDSIPPRPYIVMQLVPTGRADETMKGTPSQVTETGFMTATVVAESGEFAEAADEIADTICALFPKALRIEATSGMVTIMKPAETLQGFSDGPDWRLPVRIDYEAS